MSNTKPTVIYKGFSMNECDAYFKCPVCNKDFSGWMVFHNQINENGTNKYCPKCKTELEGLR